MRVYSAGGPGQKALLLPNREAEGCKRGSILSGHPYWALWGTASTTGIRAGRSNEGAGGGGCIQRVRCRSQRRRRRLCNVDECASYTSGFFYDGCLIGTSGESLPSYGALEQLAKAYFL